MVAKRALLSLEPARSAEQRAVVIAPFGKRRRRAEFERGFGQVCSGDSVLEVERIVDGGIHPS